MISETLRKEILNLKALERVHLVEILLESLDKPDVEVQKIWIEESEKRYDAYKAGRIKALTYEEVISRLNR